MSSKGRGLDQIVAELRKDVDVEENFRRLFDRFYGAVYRFFANRGLSAEECGDLTQETFLRVYGSIKSYRGDSRFETWLFGVVVNVYRNCMRWRHAFLRSADEVQLDRGSEPDGVTFPEPRDETESPENEALARERVDLLERAIAELPPQIRHALILRVHHDLKYREVADLLGLSVETVKSHLYQGRKRLHEALRKLDDGVE